MAFDWDAVGLAHFAGIGRRYSLTISERRVHTMSWISGQRPDENRELRRRLTTLKIALKLLVRGEYYTMSAVR